MALDWGSVFPWVGLYAGSVIAVYFGIRYEISQIRTSGDRFHDQFADKVHNLQQLALGKITGQFGTDYPTLRRLVSSPPRAPADDAEEDTLRRDFDAAAKEVEGVASSLREVAEPDTLFARALDGFDRKASYMNYTAILGILVSLYIVGLDLADLAEAGDLSQIGPVWVFVVELGVLGAATVAFLGYRTYVISSSLDDDKRKFNDEVDTKIHRIRKLPVQPPEMPTGEGVDRRIGAVGRKVDPDSGSTATPASAKK